MADVPTLPLAMLILSLASVLICLPIDEKSIFVSILWQPAQVT